MYPEDYIPRIDTPRPMSPDTLQMAFARTLDAISGNAPGTSTTLDRNARDRYTWAQERPMPFERADVDHRVIVTADDPEHPENLALTLQNELLRLIVAPRPDIVGNPYSTHPSLPYDARPVANHNPIASFQFIPTAYRHILFGRRNLADDAELARRAHFTLKHIPYQGPRDLNWPPLFDPVLSFELNFQNLRFWRAKMRDFYVRVVDLLAKEDLQYLVDCASQEGRFPDCQHNLHHNTNGLFRYDEAEMLCAFVHVLRERGFPGYAAKIETILLFLFAENAEVRFLSDRRFLDDEDVDSEGGW
jgi:hypothetical protein